MVPQVGANGTRKKGFVYFTSFGNFYVTVPRPSLTTLRAMQTEKREVDVLLKIVCFKGVLLCSYKQ